MSKLLYDAIKAGKITRDQLTPEEIQSVTQYVRQKRRDAIKEDESGAKITSELYYAAKLGKIKKSDLTADELARVKDFSQQRKSQLAAIQERKMNPIQHQGYQLSQIPGNNPTSAEAAQVQSNARAIVSQTPGGSNGLMDRLARVLPKAPQLTSEQQQNIAHASGVRSDKEIVNNPATAFGANVFNAGTLGVFDKQIQQSYPGHPVASGLGQAAGTLAPFGAAYKGARLATAGMKSGVGKIAATGALAGLPVGAATSALQGDDAKTVAKNALLYAGMGAAGDVAVEKMLIPALSPIVKRIIASMKKAPADEVAAAVAKEVGIDAPTPQQKEAILKVVEAETPKVEGVAQSTKGIVIPQGKLKPNRELKPAAISANNNLSKGVYKEYDGLTTEQLENELRKQEGRTTEFLWGTNMSSARSNGKSYMEMGADAEARTKDLRVRLGKEKYIWQRPYSEQGEAMRRLQGITQAKHKEIVQKAVADGNPVPYNVLAEYPDIKAGGASFPNDAVNIKKVNVTRGERPIVDANIAPATLKESLDDTVTIGGAGGKERKFAQSAQEAAVTPGAVKQDLKENPLTYEPITNKETFDNAVSIVNEDAGKAIEMFNSPSKGVSADDVALGEALITKAIKEGRTEDATKLIADLAEKLTTAGQAVQAASIFKRLSPEGMLLYAQRMINSANKDMLKRLGKKAPKIELTPEDSQFILDQMRKVQQMDDGRGKDIALAQVMKLISDKIPATAADKVKGLQRITLLLNPKTMVRNVAGNTIFAGLDNISNTIGTPIDMLTSKALGTKRTTTLPSIPGQLKSLKLGVKETLGDARLGIETSPGQTQYELPNKAIFRAKNPLSQTLNKLDRATRVGLQLGDRPFYKAAYDDSLRQQMKLAGVKEPTQEMIEQAHVLAQQRTYQDVNAFTQGFKKLQEGLNYISTGGNKNFGLGNFVLPFVKTPANILKRAVEYSPIGITNAIKEATKYGKGTFNQKAFVDSISRSITGTALIMVGYDLAKRGIITGSGNKDKDVAAFERNLGKNDYAIRYGNQYYTYDWAQPASMGLAIGADIYLKGKNRKDAEGVVFDAIKSGGETLYKQSLMQGIQRFMGGYSPVENIATTAINAPTMFIPTLLNQIGQITDPTQRSTYSTTGLGQGLNLVKSKIPGLNQTLQPKVDTSGNIMQRMQGKNSLLNVFVNPGTHTEYNPNEIQKEILRIYDVTGNNAVFPKVAPSYFTSKGKKITLTPEEVTKFQQTMGQDTMRRLSTIVKQKIPDDQKAKLIEYAIEKAYDAAKTQLLNSRGK